MMRSVKLLSLCLAFFFAGTVLSYAQTEAPKVTDEQKEELAASMKEFLTALDLSEEQKSEFEAITVKYAEQMKAVKESSEGKFKKMKKAKSIQESKNKEMKALLSEEQYNLYKEKQKEMKEAMKEMKNQQ